MKIIAFTMACYLLSFGLPLVGCSWKESLPERNSGGVQTLYSVDSHRAIIKDQEARATMLEEKIQRVEARIISHNRKPSRDRLGIKRRGWKRLIGEWQEEINQLKDQISWHRDEVKRLQSLTQESGISREAGDEIQEEKYNPMGFLETVKGNAMSFPWLYNR